MDTPDTFYVDLKKKKYFFRICEKNVFKSYLKPVNITANLDFYQNSTHVCRLDDFGFNLRYF